MNRACALIVVGVLMVMAACKPGTPEQYIQPGDMEDILVDYYMVKALAQHERDAGKSPYGYEYNFALYMDAVLKKYGVTKEDFDSSLVYYFTRADRFEDVLKQVQERLEEQALTMGASEGEIGKYASYNATGDTANIWADRTTALLVPTPPYNRWEFALEADSSYRRGDAFMMMYMSDFMYQTGAKDGTIYMAVEYEDTVISRNIHFSVSGLGKLRVPEDTTRTIKGIKGFFYLNAGSEPSTSTRLLFLNNVQLIRFHTKPAEYEPNDSIARDSVGGQLPADTIGGRDTIGGGDPLFSPDRRGTVHRVDARTDSAAT